MWNGNTGERLAEVATSRKVTHGVINLASYETVATADVGKQAGGISFWRLDR